MIISEKSKDAQEIVITPQKKKLNTLVHAEETHKSGDNKSNIEQTKKEAKDIREEAQPKDQKSTMTEKPTVTKKTISGWCFLGRFNSKLKEWIHINIEEEYLDKDYSDRTPVKDDKVKLAKTINLRTGKPRFPLYKMGTLITSLPRETVLTIKNIDNKVGRYDYTWAEVELEWPTVP